MALQQEQRSVRFQRRLRLLVGVVAVGALVMIVRAAQVQVLERNEWQEKAEQIMRRPQMVQTIRGSILDRKGRQLAEDQACIDACVEYRALLIEPDPKWLRETAIRRRAKKREALLPGEVLPTIAEESDLVRRDLREMWEVLGSLPGSSPEKVDQTRRDIIRRVEMRRRFVWYRNYERAVVSYQKNPPAWYQRWLAGESADGPDLDDFAIEVGEQTEAHPILKNIPAETYNLLARNLDFLPGLVLRPGVVRVYPYGDVGPHVIGQMTKVTREDLSADPFEAAGDELKRYQAHDTVGRTGLEAMAESTLRGSRGRIVRAASTDDIVESISPVRGQDVAVTLDIELQRDVQNLFKNWKLQKGQNVIEQHPMHGAAVVISLQTSEVLALASYPTFDPNTLEENYEELLRDEINQPLLHRATMSMYEPGSTVKPAVGLAGITAGVIGHGDTVECTGYLVLGGRKYDMGRCWTMSKFNTGHHTVPWSAPHENGFLDLEDAVQRSCNVYFETIGDRLKIEGLSQWLDRFGLGRPTGIGIPESAGRIPGQFRLPSYLKRSTAWFASIGQGKIGATPLQMANVTATIARNGVWMRPVLVLPNQTIQPVGATGTTLPASPVDLGLSKPALAAAHRGMVKVVNTKGGTAKENARNDITLAGKTGTAEAAPFTYRVRDEFGQLVYDSTGKVMRKELELSTPARPNPLAPWYRGSGSDHTSRNHAWFVGFAPAEKPTIAFAVMVEYGGSGGEVAGPVADGIIDALMKHGYLIPSGR